MLKGNEIHMQISLFYFPICEFQSYQQSNGLENLIFKHLTFFCALEFERKQNFYEMIRQHAYIGHLGM